MFDRDLLCRSVHYPKYLDRNQGGTGLWSAETFLDFQPSDETKAVYRTSVASKWLMKSIDRVHEYGIRAARSKNARVAAELGEPPEPLSSKAVHYLGFYEFEYSTLGALKLNHYTAEAFWSPEDGEDAHFQLQLRKVGTCDQPKALRQDRRAAYGAVGSRLVGPYRGIAPEDQPVIERLQEIDLPSLPA